MPMPERRWVNSTQPQTLQIGVVLLYLNAAFLVIFGALAGGLGLIGLALAVAEGAGGFGIANERKWGYRLGVGAAVVVLAFALFTTIALAFRGNILNLVIDVALVALLLHPQSRDYRRIWFK
ncbi:MAG: hypothetical protein ACRDZQ_16380 [Acidimicrobiales bacterium]